MELKSLPKLISNPDLVERFRKNAPLNGIDMPNLYAGSAKGYTDYPFLSDSAS